jgi:UDP-N-acetylmuramoyl-tripeptide--D-alanyl-D-alanine ligase
MMSILDRVKTKCILLISPIIRRLTRPEKYLTIASLFEIVKDTKAELNSTAKLKGDSVVNEVCTLSHNFKSFYFPANFACLVSDRDTAEKAILKGAVLLITSSDYEEYPCLVTENPVLTYACLCRYYRDLSNNLFMTVVSGSLGKTTVKNMIGEVYKVRYKTTYTRANYNAKTAVGFAVQHIPTNAQMMIQEIHEGTPDETRYVSKMLNPDLFAMTPIDKSHFERFGSVQKIKEEICSITEYMRDSGSVIVDVDEFKDFDLLGGKRIISISSSDPSADFSLKGVHVSHEGLEFSIHVKETDRDHFVRLHNIYAPHNAQCALYAFAAGYHVGIEPSYIIRGLQNYRTSGDRQNVFKTQDGVLVYADCYNAVGRSMKSAIDTASGISVSGKRIAVLGDVAEAGATSIETHKSIIHYVNDSSFDYLLVIGEALDKALSEVKTRDALTVISAKTLEELSEIVRKIVLPGDLILFKASHASNLSECIKLVWPKEYQKRIATVNHKEYGEWFYNVIKY